MEFATELYCRCFSVKAENFTDELLLVLVPVLEV